MDSNGLRIMLPWPDPILNPNVKVHWAAKRDAKDASRDAAFYLARNTGITLDPQKHYTVNLVFCPPDNRSRDLDNALGAAKWILDGMCRALGINDKMIRPIPDWGPVVARGKVEVTITELVLDNAPEKL